MTDNITQLYNQLISTGYKPEAIGADADEFRKNLQDPANRDKLYQNLVSSGYQKSAIGSNASEFGDILGMQQTPDTTSVEGQPAEQTMPKKSYTADMARLSGTPVSDGFTYDPASKQLKPKYVTPTGKTMTDKLLADVESVRYRDYIDNGTVAGQLRNAQKRYDDVQKRMDERMQTLKTEHEQNKPSGLAGFIQSMGQTMTADKMGGYQGDNPEEWNEVRTDKDYQALKLQAANLEKQIQGLQNAQDKERNEDTWWYPIWAHFRNFGQEVSGVAGWDFGKLQQDEKLRRLNVEKDLELGKELTAEQEAALEEIALQQFVEQNYVNKDVAGARWGTMGGMMPKFFAEFAITGGFSNFAKGLATKAATEVAERMAAKGAVNNLGKKVAQEGLRSVLRSGGKGTMQKLLKEQGISGLAGILTTKSLGVGATDLLLRAPLMMATTGAMSTTAKVIDEKLGNVVEDEEGKLKFEDDKSWGEAAWQAGADQLIEYFSEMWGAHLPGVSDALKTFGARNLSAAVLKATREGAGTVLSKTSNFLSRAGVNGYFGEVGEEYYGQLWRTMLGLDAAYDNKGKNLMLDPQFHGDIWAGLALSIGMTGAATMTGTYGIQKTLDGANYLANKHQVNKADKIARSLFNDEQWNDLRTIIDATENAQMGDFIEGLAKERDLTTEQKNAVMNYTGSLLQMRGHNLGELLRRKAGKNPSVANIEQSENYMEGYNETDAQQRNKLAVRLDYQRERMRALFGNLPDETIDGLVGEDMQQFINECENSNTYTEEDLDIIRDYADARTTYEGMMQRVRDDMDDKRAEVGAAVDARINRQDDMLHPAITKDNKEVYIIQGNAHMEDSGEEDSTPYVVGDKSIVIYDAATGEKKMVSSDTLLSVGELQNPLEVKQTAEDAAVEEIADEAERQIGGAVDYTPGAQYVMRDEFGQDHQVEIQMLDEASGNVQVVYDGQLTAMPAEMVEEGINRYRVETTAEEIENERVLRDAEKQSATTEEVTPEAEEAAPIEEPAVEQPQEEPAVDITKQKVPLDEKQNPLYTQASVEDALADIYEKLGTTYAGKFINSNIAEAKKALKKLDLKEPEITADMNKNIENLKKLEESKKAAKDIEATLAYWEEVKKQHEQVTHTQETAESEAEDITDLGEPLDVYEAVAGMLGHSIKITPESFKAEGAGGAEEMRSMPGVVAKAENGGISIDRAAEELAESGVLQQYGVSDDADIRNILIDVLSGGNPRGYIKKHRAELRKQEEEFQTNELENFARKNFDMSAEEYQAYEETALAYEMARFSNVDEDALLAAFNDQINKENETEQTSGAADNSSAVLQEKQPADEKRDQDTAGEGQEGTEGPGAEVSGEDETASAQTEGTAESEVNATQQQIESAREQTDTNPTEAQKAAGNYRKGKVTIDGMTISIENPKGSTRSGKDANGKEWSVKMNYDYGYILGTESVDGDHIDVYLSENPTEGNVYVIDQVNQQTGEFDEHKVMYGFNSMEEAVAAYKSQYEEGWKVGPVTEVTREEFKKWIDSSKRKGKPFSEYKNIKAESGVSQGDNVDNAEYPSPVNKDGYVCDVDGNPLTMYHGTQNTELTSASQLEPGHHRTDGEKAMYNGDGVSFTPDETVAQDYADGGNVLKARVRLKKPYISYGIANMTQQQAEDFTSTLKKQGYDGVVVYATEQWHKDGALPIEVVAFDNSAIEDAESVAEEVFTPGLVPEGNADFNVFDFVPNKKGGEKSPAMYKNGKIYASVSERPNAVVYIGKAEYDKRLEGKMVDAKGKETDARKIPVDVADKIFSYTYNFVTRADVKGVAERLAKEVERLKGAAKDAMVSFEINGEEIYIPINNALSFFKVAAAMGAESIQLRNDGRAAYPANIKAETKNGSVFVVVSDKAYKDGEVVSLRLDGTGIYELTAKEKEQNRLGRMEIKAMLATYSYYENKGELSSKGYEKVLAEKREALNHSGENGNSERSAKLRGEIRALESLKNLAKDDEDSIRKRNEEASKNPDKFIRESYSNWYREFLLAEGLTIDGMRKSIANANKELKKYEERKDYANIADTKGFIMAAETILKGMERNDNNSIRNSLKAKNSTDKRENKEEETLSVNAKPFTPGLVRDEYTKTHVKEDLIDKIAKKLGIRVVFVDSIDREGKKNVANADYERDSRTIYVQKNNPNPIYFLIGHEITHRMRHLSEDAYKSYKEAAIASMPDFEERKERIRRLYESHGMHRSDDVLEEEVVADYAGELARDRGTLDAFINNSEPPIWQKILNVLREIASLFSSKMKERVAIDNAIAKLEDALNKASAEVTKEKGGESNIRYSLIGEKGASNLDKANEASRLLDDLAVAREMEKAKKDAKAIKLATGWERGADGKWRYEIDDYLDKINVYANAAWGKRHPDYQRYSELSKKLGAHALWGDEPLTEAEQKEYDTLREKYKDYNMWKPQVNVDNLTVKDFIDNDELFTAYPEIADMSIEIKNLPEGTRGNYSRENKTIALNKELFDEAQGLSQAAKGQFKSTLLHEIQHAIQEIEGFTQGSSIEYFQNKEKIYGATEFDNVVDELNRAFLMVKEADESLYTTIGRVLKDKNFEDYRNSLDSKDREVLNTLKNMYSYMSEDVFMDNYNGSIDNAKYSRLTPFQRYERTAGEVEARNVQSRMNMTPEQRRQTLAQETEDVAREDQIILNDVFDAYDEEVKYSLKQLDAEYMQAVENKDETKMRELVDKAKELSGYTEGEEYQGTTDQFGSAPSSNGFYDTKEERLEAWRNEEFEDTQTFGDIADGIEINSNADYITGAQSPSRLDAARKEVVSVLKPLLKKMKAGDKDIKVRMYRAIPADVKGTKLRRGDWVTPSKLYAQEHGEHKFGEGKYRIVEEDVSPEEMWWDGNDIAEWGFDDEKEYAYKNTANNRKSDDLITYDDNGNVIPLSERFNPDKADVRFSLKDDAETKQIFADAKANGTYLKAPNGKPTNLSPEQWAQVRTKNFINWFGDWINDPENASKVVDENGEPLVVYHGTDADFYTFDKSKVGQNYRDSEDGGFFFTNSKMHAENFADLHALQHKKEPRVISAFLNIKKPLTRETYDYYGAVTHYDRDSWSLLKELREDEEDGIIIKAKYGGNFYMAIDPNQIKSATDNNGEFSKTNNDIRYSIKEDKSLVGIHNIFEDKLRKAIKMGGLANPSAAVINIDKQDHESFGTISLIMPSSLVDKRTGKNAGTYTGDAWTPRYPRIEYILDKKSEAFISNIMHGLISDNGLYVDTMYGLDEYMSNGRLRELSYAFLKSKGIEPEIVDKGGMDITRPYFDEKFGTKGLDGLDAWQKALSAPDEVWEEFNLWRLARGKKDSYDKYKSFLNDKYKRELWKEHTANKDFGPFENFMANLDYAERNKGKIDSQATMTRANDYISLNGLSEEFEQWAEKLVKDAGAKAVFFDGRTPSGKRRYKEATLANISKKMKSEGKTNVYDDRGFQATRAMLINKLGSLEQIRRHKDLLSSEDSDINKFNEYAEEYSQLVAELAVRKKISSNEFSNLDYTASRLQEALQKKDPTKYLNDEYDYNLGDEFKERIDAFVKNVKNLPVKYFETKFERPVMLNEFAAAVVPDNVGEDIRKALSDAGLTIFDYEHDNSESRREATLKATETEGVRFSLKENLDTASSKSEEAFNQIPEGRRTSILSSIEDMKNGYRRHDKEMVDKAFKDISDQCESVFDMVAVNRYLIDVEKTGWSPNMFATYFIMHPEENAAVYMNTDETKALEILQQQVDGINDVDTVGYFKYFIVGSIPSRARSIYRKGINQVKNKSDERIKTILKESGVSVRTDFEKSDMDANDYTNLFYSLCENSELTKLFEKVMKVASALPIKYNFRKIRGNASGDYYGDIIRLNLNYFNDPSVSNQKKAEVMLHELIHSVTVYAMDAANKSLKDVRLTEGMKEAVSEIEHVYFLIRNDVQLHKEYGMTNAKEMMAELSNPVFRDKLAKKNLLQRVVDALKKLFGIDKTDALSQLEGALDYMLENFDRSAYNEYVHIAKQGKTYLTMSKREENTLAEGGSYCTGGGLLEVGLGSVMKPKFAVEYDKNIAGVYSNNFGDHVVIADVRDVDPVELAKEVNGGHVQYFHASPVCKNFSTANNKAGETEFDWEIAMSTAEALEALEPDVFTLENVWNYKDSESLEIVKRALDKMGYMYDIDVYNAADYGAATSRKRLILRAVRNGLTIPPKPAFTERAKGWLPEVEDLIETLESADIPDWMQKRIKKEKIDIKNLKQPLYIFGTGSPGGGLRMAYGDEVLPTITTAGGDRIFMPDGRVLAVSGRVLARITGLPDDYILPESDNFAHLIIGNGIPVALTKAVIAPLIESRIIHAKERRKVTEKIDKEYMESIRNHDREKTIKLFRQYAYENADDNIVFMDYAVGYRSKNNADIAKKIKEGHEEAIREAVYRMKPHVPEGSILVPMPSSDGKASEGTLKLVEALAKDTKSEMRDILEGLPRTSVYESKKRGTKMTTEMLGFHATEELPTDRNVIIVDNVIDRGTTAAAAVRAVKGAAVLAYAFTKGNKNRTAALKLIDPVTYDDKKNVIPLSERMNPKNNDVRYSLKDEGHADVFYSNAAHAVESIKQNKATPEQWLKMIEKNGGLKAGEDKWLGLGDWLKNSDAKTLTKEEVMDYIKSNEIQIEEVKYGEEDVIVERKKSDLKPTDFKRYGKEDGYRNDIWLKNGDRLSNTCVVEATLKATGETVFVPEIQDKYLTSFDADVPLYYNTLDEAVDAINKTIDNYNSKLGPKKKVVKHGDINNTRLMYTTNRLDNYLEIALTVPTIDPWNENDEIHFGDAGEGRAVAWVRFGETTDEDGKRVLVIDEVQSKRHQEGREKGYTYEPKELRQAKYSYRRISHDLKIATEEIREYDLSLFEKYGSGYKHEASENELKKLEELKNAESDLVSQLMGWDSERELRNREGVKPAPFEKNWPELAMKRMLRYAVENGYDKVAWTTGTQQAVRYGLGGYVNKIDANNDGGSREINIFFKDGREGTIYTDTEGVIESSTLNGLKGKPLSEVVGKELADDVLSIPDGEKKDYTNENLMLGGSGMKAFYDKMIPSFMNKYVKKWGTKVSDVTLPELGEADRVMHSVEVTPEMKNSVMEGQPMFSLKDDNDRFESALEEYNAKQKGMAEKFKQAYFDGMKALKDLQDAIAKESGSDVKDYENAYMSQNQMSSRNKAETEVYKRDFIEPLVAEVAKVAGGPEGLEGLNNYLIAKHGLERNRVFRERDARRATEEWVRKQEREVSDEEKEAKYNDELSAIQNRDYAGLTELTKGMDENVSYTEKAQFMVDDYESTHDTETLWELINAATRQSLYKARMSGLLSKENYDYIRSMFEFYVPLKGWDNNEAAEVYDYYGTPSQLFAPYMHKAEGRTSKAFNVISNIAFDGQSAIRQGNRNLMLQHLLNLVQGHKTPLATANKQWYEINSKTGDWDEADFDDKAKKAYNGDYDAWSEHMNELKEQGMARQKAVPLSTGLHMRPAEKIEHKVSMMRNGERWAVYVNGDPSAAQAINGMLNADNSNSWLRQIQQNIKNFMARAFTSNNPAFVLSNMARDIIWAGTAVKVKEDGEYSKKFSENLRHIIFGMQTFKLLKKFEKDELDMSDETEKYFKEFLMNGGETGFTALLTAKDYKKDIDRLVKDLHNGVNPVKKVWRGGWDFVEYCNRSVEDISRFATYVTSRQMGRSIEKSIYDAKEITVNFNTKGSGEMGAKYANFAYIFFNAAMQSISNFGRLAYNHPLKFTKQIAKFMMYGLMAPGLAIMASMMFGGDDDKDAYFDLPKWVRENNIVLRVADGTFITIPLPHELRPFYAFGENLLCVLCGKESVGDALFNSIMGFSSMLPLDFTGNSMNPVVNFFPTYGQPFVQIGMNTDFFGKPIYKEGDYIKDSPEWQKAYKGTSPILVTAAKWWNEAFGGNDVKSSKFILNDDGTIGINKLHFLTDVNPAWVEHIIESYFGGMGKTINKTASSFIQIGENISEGKWEWQWRSTPVVSSFVQGTDERTSGSSKTADYYDLVKTYDEMQKLYNGYQKEAQKGRTEYQEKFRELVGTKDFARRYFLLQTYINNINSLNKIKKSTISESAQKTLDEAIRKQKEQLLEKYREIDNERK